MAVSYLHGVRRCWRSCPCDQGCSPICHRYLVDLGLRSCLLSNVCHLQRELDYLPLQAENERLTVWFMLGLEVFEVVLVMRVILRLLVLGKLGVVTIFH